MIGTQRLAPQTRRPPGEKSLAGAAEVQTSSTAATRAMRRPFVKAPTPILQSEPRGSRLLRLRLDACGAGGRRDDALVAVFPAHAETRRLGLDDFLDHAGTRRL